VIFNLIGYSKYSSNLIEIVKLRFNGGSFLKYFIYLMIFNLIGYSKYISNLIEIVKLRFNRGSFLKYFIYSKFLTLFSHIN